MVWSGEQAMSARDNFPILFARSSRGIFCILFCMVRRNKETVKVSTHQRLDDEVIWKTVEILKKVQSQVQIITYFNVKLSVSELQT